MLQEHSVEAFEGAAAMCVSRQRIPSLDVCLQGPVAVNACHHQQSSVRDGERAVGVLCNDELLEHARVVVRDLQPGHGGCVVGDHPCVGVHGGMGVRPILDLVNTGM